MRDGMQQNPPQLIDIGEQYQNQKSRWILISRQALPDLVVRKQ